MIDKSINNIDCVAVRSRPETNLSTAIDIIYNTTVINAYNGSEVIKLNINESLKDLEDDVCRAEIDSQILDSALNVYTAPFGKLYQTRIHSENILVLTSLFHLTTSHSLRMAGPWLRLKFRSRL